jgi:hypothetical protein
MNDCVRCGDAILGDGTEDSDFGVLCRTCKGNDCYEMLVEECDE